MAGRRRPAIFFINTSLSCGQRSPPGFRWKVIRGDAAHGPESLEFEGAFSWRVQTQPLYLLARKMDLI
jgi:hypothetical protein